MIKGKVLQGLRHPYSLIGMGLVWVMLGVVAVYERHQWTQWQAAAQQGRAYAAIIARGQDRTWIGEWQMDGADKLTRLQDVAARQNLQILSYEAVGRDANQYVVRVNGTFSHILQFLQCLEGEQPPLFCQSISIGRSDVEGILVCEIIV